MKPYGNILRGIYDNGISISDAFIPATSQRGDGSGSWRTGNGRNLVTQREAFGVNHLEEIDANNSEMRRIFNEIFLADPGSGIDLVFKINKR